MNNKMSLVIGVLIGLLLGGGSVFLILHHHGTAVRVTESTTSTQASSSIPLSTGGVNTPAAPPGSAFSPTPIATPDPLGVLTPQGIATTPPVQTGKSPDGKPNQASPAESPADRVPGVHLSPEQNAQIDALSAEVQRELIAIKADTNSSDNAKNARAQQVYKDADARVLKILTPAQRKANREFMQKQQKLAQQQMDAHDPLAGLHLTPEQRARVESVHMNALKEALAVTQNPKYSKEDQERIMSFISQQEMKQIREIVNPSSKPTHAAGPAKPAPVPANNPAPVQGPVKEKPMGSTPAPGK